LPNYFFASSALVKLYHPEAGTPQVEAIFQQAERRVIISRLTIIELESALSTKVRTGAISIEQREKAGLRILQNGSDGTFRVVALLELHLSSAKQLILRHGVDSGLRTLDALQLSVAIQLHSRALIDFVDAADRTLASVARAEGLQVIDPLTI